MKLTNLWKEKDVTLSFEAFPPKKDSDFASVAIAVEKIAQLKPDFMSVTYGAGGGTSAYTTQIAQIVQGQGVTALAHLTCVSSDRQRIHHELDALRQAGIENILALRGDYPEGYDPAAPRDYRYARDLVEDIRAYGGFAIGGACYPEGHVECASQAEDLRHLKEKVDCGVDFLVTQMFFDNSALYSFLYRAQEAGITVPVLAGIMPVTNAGQMTRILSLSGTTLPNRFRMILDKFRERPDAMKQAGIVYAAEQMVDLVANGVRGVHVYTMNKPDVAAGIWRTSPMCWGGADQAPDPREVARYLGIPGGALDGPGGAYAAACWEELRRGTAPRGLHQRVDLAPFRAASRDLDHHLRHCRGGHPLRHHPGGGGRPAPPAMERPVHGQGRRGPGGVRRLAGRVVRGLLRIPPTGPGPGGVPHAPLQPWLRGLGPGGPADRSGPPPGPQTPGPVPHRGRDAGAGEVRHRPGGHQRPA